MKEQELRALIRESIIERFKVKSKLIKENADSQDEEILHDLTSMHSAIEKLAASVMSNAKSTDNKKQTESVAMTAGGVLLGLPGLLEMMAKLAKVIRKKLNKYKETGVTEEEEGKTFEKWAHTTHKFYIDRIFSPIVKVIFKKYVGNDPKKVKTYATVLYAVILAAVAGDAVGTAGAHAWHGLKDLGHTFNTAYEALHGFHGVIDATKMSHAIMTAFEVIGEEVVLQSV